MAKPAVYVVRITLNPGVATNVNRTEYERLIELNVLSALDQVLVPPDDIVISSTEPVAEFVGQVWFNPTVAGP